MINPFRSLLKLLFCSVLRGQLAFGAHTQYSDTCMHPTRIYTCGAFTHSHTQITNTGSAQTYGNMRLMMNGLPGSVPIPLGAALGCHVCVITLDVILFPLTEAMWILTTVVCLCVFVFVSGGVCMDLKRWKQLFEKLRKRHDIQKTGLGKENTKEKETSKNFTKATTHAVSYYDQQMLSHLKWQIRHAVNLKKSCWRRWNKQINGSKWRCWCWSAEVFLFPEKLAVTEL